ncbi:diaboline synthase-like [Apium graveolens]|uniref:diaboline synthase-like n=1 Tax=Apium graveolens TaxID=4045 RepID=UPI003D7924EA
MIGRLILGASIISRRQLHVISRSETYIKPASPTPLNLKKYDLSYHDRMFPNLYISMILFYSNPQQLPSKTTMPNLLKNSLSKALSKYYPFAGRLRSAGSYVDCNDQGVQFYEARIACTLSEILKRAAAKEEQEGFGHLFPPGSVWANANVSDSCLVVVQLNHFSCGGIAIAVNFTHRTVDGSTLLSFLNYWASLSRNPSDEENLVHLHPHYVYELLPQSCNENVIATQASFPQKHWITMEVVFPNSKIAQLKANQERQDKRDGVVSDQKYTRNELVTALLYRCSVAAATSSNSGVYTNSVLFQTVDMRSLLDPPMPKTTVGNLFVLNHMPTGTMSEIMINSMVRQMRKAKMQLKGIKSMDEIEGVMPLVDKYSKTNHKMYFVSSICKFPFYDVMDFGWGRHVRATVVDAPFVNCFFMADTPSKDGIQVTVNLEEEDMKSFRADSELLAYASFKTES